MSFVSVSFNAKSLPQARLISIASTFDLESVDGFSLPNMLLHVSPAIMSLIGICNV